MVQQEGSVAGGLPGGNLSHSGASTSEVLAQLDEKEVRARKRRPNSAWKKPNVKVYQDNFGFAVNAYQPMIDYINKKDCGEKPERDVHLPLLEERCMKPYQSCKPVYGYNNSDIDFFIDKGQKIRESIRHNDAAGISNVINRTHTNWSMTRKYVQLVKHSVVSDYKKRLHDIGIEDNEQSPVNCFLNNLPKNSVELENIPRKTPPAENYCEKTPRPNYIDDSCVDFARALEKINKMDSEEAVMARRAKIEALDQRFEQAVDKMCSYVDNLTRPMSTVEALANNHCQSTDYFDRAQKRRDIELANLEESVFELTDKSSHRNQLRGKLQQQHQQIQDQLPRGELITEQEVREALSYIHEKRLNSRARSKYEYEKDDVDNYLPVENLGLAVQAEPKMVSQPVKKPAADKGPVITDTYANVVARASDMACLTSEMRKISNRSRFVNCYKPQINTDDKNQVVHPTKLEMNIEHMANTLAMDGKMRRRFEIDEEIDAPPSNLNSQMKEKYADHVIHKTTPMPPSNSMRVRRADLRAQSRVTLLGY